MENRSIAGSRQHAGRPVVHEARSHQGRRVAAMLSLGAVAATVAVTTPVVAQGRPDSAAMQQHMQQQQMQLVRMAPYRGYLQAHNGVDKPLGLMGGPVHVTITQPEGGVFVALPDRRTLDEAVFGTPAHPRAFGGTPGINGVPPMARGSQNEHYTSMTMPSPFGDKYLVLPGGQLSVDLVDATATDAATSNDRVKVSASWKDKAGNTYSVQCCAMLATHGIEYPTFGGVVTNHILHGSSRVGTALMPTEFTYAAFWGIGSVSVNGNVVDDHRLIHGMLTEYVRAQGYTLAADSAVTPTRMQFHLMVPPFMPNPKEGRFDPSAVHTGFKLPNGMELPFWHVMFENLHVNSEREQQ